MDESDDRIRVNVDALRGYVAAMFEACEVPAADAVLAADVLVTADERGVESHGVSNLTAVYVERLLDGFIVANPRVEILRSTLATGSLDGGRGLGVVVAPRAMDLAIDKARSCGVGIVTVRNTRHLAMAAYHAMRALPHDMIGICMTAVGPRVVPTHGREPRLGTNPIALAAPAEHEPPFVFDAATTTVAMNVVRLAQLEGREVPPGVFADEWGRPIMQPSFVPDGYKLLPLGAVPEMGSHKGYGLASMIEVLASVLAGSEVVSTLGIGHANHIVAAIDIAAFTEPDAFRETMDRFMRRLKDTPPVDEDHRVRVAGDLEHTRAVDRRANGVPLRRTTVEELESLGRSLNVDAGLLHVPTGEPR
jgi:L-2-hydroxycarboxylate dehydrogenase (NAD+)